MNIRVDGCLEIGLFDTSLTLSHVEQQEDLVIRGYMLYIHHKGN